MTITAILPAYNEEVSIGSIILNTRQYADCVIFANNGSTDRTAKLAELAGAEIIRHPPNKGKGNALKTGSGPASQSGAKVIVTLDSDNQHNPEEIPNLIKPILAGEAQVVIGSRYMNSNGKNTPFYGYMGQSVLDIATNMNSGLKVTDSQSGFRAFSVNIVPVFSFKQNGPVIESELLIDAVKTEYPKRTEGWNNVRI